MADRVGVQREDGEAGHMGDSSSKTLPWSWRGQESAQVRDAGSGTVDPPGCLTVKLSTSLLLAGLSPKDVASLALLPRWGDSCSSCHSHFDLSTSASDKASVDVFPPVAFVQSHMQELFYLCLSKGRARKEIFFPLMSGGTSEQLCVGEEYSRNCLEREFWTALGVGVIMKQCQTPRSIPLNSC